MKTKCPYCKHIQVVEPKDEKIEKMAKFFSWKFATSVNCKSCGEVFVEENNLVEEECD